IPLKTRYGTILSIENTTLHEKYKKYFLIEGLYYVIFNIDNLMYKLMASQYIIKLLNNETSKKYINYDYKVKLFVVDTCLNHSDYNIRADAADVLINSNDQYLINIGNVEINNLGTGSDYYNNSQNVHIKSIIENCQKNIEKLSTLVKITYDIDFILTDFKSSINDETKFSKIEPAIERIIVDRTTYTKYNMTLLNIFCKIYSYIYIHDHKLSILDRLYSELIDSVGLCSSGFMAQIGRAHV